MTPWLYIPWFEAHDILPGVDPQTNAWQLPLGSTSLPIQPFGVLVATGVLLAARAAEEFGKKQGVHPRVVSDYVTHIVFGGFIGAFFLNALFYEPENFVQFFLGLGRLVASLPGALFQGKGLNTDGLRYLGLSSYGGFIGFTLALFWWRKKRGWSSLHAADAGAFGFPLGWMFGRTGCFITHDHPGQVTDFFMAVDNYREGGAPRHDLGLYEVIWSAATFGLFVLLARKQRRPGFYLGLVCILYGPVRFGLDFLRATPAQGGDVRYFGLTPGQYGSVAALLAGAAVLRYIHTHDSPSLSDEEKWPDPTEPPKTRETPTKGQRVATKKRGRGR